MSRFTPAPVAARRSSNEVALAHRAHEEVADEPDDEQPGHDVHRRRVGVGLRDAMRDLVFANVVHEHRTDDAGSRPRGEQAAVDRAHLNRAEQVAQVGRDRREAAAVHADDDHVAEHEQTHVPGASGGRHDRVERSAEEKERRVRAPCGRWRRRATTRRSGRPCSRG